MSPLCFPIDLARSRNIGREFAVRTEQNQPRTIRRCIETSQYADACMCVTLDLADLDKEIDRRPRAKSPTVLGLVEYLSTGRHVTVTVEVLTPHLLHKVPR